jgi:outer membrane lipoprotein LolB
MALLPGCSAIRPVDGEQAARQPLYDQRVARLEQQDSWSLEGRLAVSDEKDGGSGYLSWRQQGASSRMDFHGVLGRGAWRLFADPDGAELEFADGTQYRADTIDALVRGQVGWQVPVETLAWWVRGLAAPGKYKSRLLDEEGRLSQLEQDGWSIEFGRYGAVEDVTMPLRMTARQDDRTVKLAIRKWELPSADQP